MNPEQPKNTSTIANSFSGIVIMNYFASGFVPAKTDNFAFPSVMIRLTKIVAHSAADDFPIPVIVDGYRSGTAFRDPANSNLTDVDCFYHGDHDTIAHVFPSLLYALYRQTSDSPDHLPGLATKDIRRVLEGRIIYSYLKEC